MIAQCFLWHNIFIAIVFCSAFLTLASDSAC